MTGSDLSRVSVMAWDSPPHDGKVLEMAVLDWRKTSKLRGVKSSDRAQEDDWKCLSSAKSHAWVFRSPNWDHAQLLSKPSFLPPLLWDRSVKWQRTKEPRWHSLEIRSLKACGSLRLHLAEGLSVSVNAELGFEFGAVRIHPYWYSRFNITYKLIKTHPIHFKHSMSPSDSPFWNITSIPWVFMVDIIEN